MNRNNVYRKFLRGLMLFSMAFLLKGCVEPFEFEAETFESALVIEGRITDVVRQHEIRLTRTYAFEEDGPTPVEDALVRVVSGQGEFLFEEEEPGIYRSVEAFGAAPGTSYQLKISTPEGDYSSEPAELTPRSVIGEIRAIRTANAEGVDGMILMVDGQDPSGIASYFRYEFEETFKIQSLFKSTRDFALHIETNEMGEEEVVVTTVPKKREEFTCYRTETSGGIILANTSTFNSSTVDDFVFHFIRSGDPRIAYRYSVLVKQFVLSEEAYSFYSTLKELSGAESLFSQHQAGFLRGNIYSEDNEVEKVIGFFNVASEASERFFFSFEEFYAPGEGGQSFMENCELSRPEGQELIDLIRNGSIEYIEDAKPAEPDEEGGGDFRVVSTHCADCNLIGSNQVPEFWEE